VNEGTTTLRIWNLTPHAIVYDDGLHRQEFPSDATVRLAQKESTDDPQKNGQRKLYYAAFATLSSSNCTGLTFPRAV
jgi:hypothetical protein